VLTRRGLLAGLFTLPIVRALAPLAKLSLTEPAAKAVDVVEYGKIVVPSYFDLSDPETVDVWSRELSRAVAQSTPLMNRHNGWIGYGPNSPIILHDRTAGTGV
jgi:hypothetical protein